MLFQVLKRLCCFVSKCDKVNRKYLCCQYKLNSMFWSSRNSHNLGQTTIYVEICCLCSLQLNLARKCACSFVVDKVVIMDLFCFDITEKNFKSNIDLIPRFLDGCIGYCCTAQLTIWLTWFLMNPYECFLSIAILSRSSQTRFAVNEFVVNEFSGVFFIFFNGFFCLS